MGGKGSKDNTPEPRSKAESFLWGQVLTEVGWAGLGWVVVVVGAGWLTSWAVLSSPSVRALCPHPTHALSRPVGR